MINTKHQCKLLSISFLIFLVLSLGGGIDRVLANNGSIATSKNDNENAENVGERLYSIREGDVLSGTFDACTPRGKSLGQGELTVLFQEIPPMKGSSRNIKVISKLTINDDTVISEALLENRARYFAGNIGSNEIKTLSVLPPAQYHNGDKLLYELGYLSLKGPSYYKAEQSNLVVNFLRWATPNKDESFVCGDKKFTINPVNKKFDIESEIAATQKPESAFYDKKLLNKSMPFEKGQFWEGFQLDSSGYYGTTIGILSVESNEFEGAVYLHGFSENRKYLHDNAVMLFRGRYDAQEKRADIKGINFLYSPATNWVTDNLEGSVDFSSNTFHGVFNNSGTFEVKLASPDSPRIQQAKQIFNKHFDTQASDKKNIYVEKNKKILATQNGIFNTFKQKVFCPESINDKILQANGVKGFYKAGRQNSVCGTPLASGFNVWVKPYWYVWDNMTEEAVEIEPDRHVQASANGKYTKLIAKYRCPSVDNGWTSRENGSEYDWNTNYINNYSEECGYMFKEGYYVWDKPFFYGWANLDQQRVDFLKAIEYRDKQLSSLLTAQKDNKALLKKYPQKEKCDICFKKVNKFKAEAATVADYELCVNKFNDHLSSSIALEKRQLPLYIFGDVFPIGDDYTPEDVQQVAIMSGVKFIRTEEVGDVRYDHYNTSRLHADFPSGVAVFVDPSLFSGFKLAMFMKTNEAEFNPTLYTGYNSGAWNIGSIIAEVALHNLYERTMVKQNGPNTPDCPGKYGILNAKDKIQNCWTRDSGKTQLLIMESSSSQRRWQEYRNLKYFKTLKKEFQD